MFLHKFESPLRQNILFGSGFLYCMTYRKLKKNTCNFQTFYRLTFDSLESSQCSDSSVFTHWWHHPPLRDRFPVESYIYQHLLPFHSPTVHRSCYMVPSAHSRAPGPAAKFHRSPQSSSENPHLPKSYP